MPDHNSSDVPLSQQINEVRGLLLKALKAQLDDLIAEKLTPQPSGVPFIHFEKDPPQIATLKKSLIVFIMLRKHLKAGKALIPVRYWVKPKQRPN